MIAIQILLKRAFALIFVGTLTIQDNPSRNHGPLTHAQKWIIVGGNEKPLLLCRDTLASMLFKTEENPFLEQNKRQN